MAKIEWREDGWTTIQEADTSKHIMEIECRAEAGTVVEVRIRHSRGEEEAAKVLYNGKAALPLAIAEFRKLYENGELEIR